MANRNRAGWTARTGIKAVSAAITRRRVGVPEWLSVGALGRPRRSAAWRCLERQPSSAPAPVAGVLTRSGGRQREAGGGAWRRVPSGSRWPADVLRRQLGGRLVPVCGGLLVGAGIAPLRLELDVLGHDHDLGARVAVAVFPALLLEAAHDAHAAALAEVLGAHGGELAPGGGLNEGDLLVALAVHLVGAVARYHQRAHRRALRRVAKLGIPTQVPFHQYGVEVVHTALLVIVRRSRRRGRRTRPRTL